MDRLPDYFMADRLTPINFYGYTSSPKDRIFEIDVHQSTQQERYKEEIQRFHDLKLKCMMMEVDMRRPNDPDPVWCKDIWDDKITIECQTENGEIIYVGYWGCTFSIGKDISKRNRDPKPYKAIVNPMEELSLQGHA